MSSATGDEYFWFLDTLVAVRVPHTLGTDTLSLLEHRAPEGHSPPCHVHRNEDELFHVLDGEFRFQIGDDERRLTAGAYVLAPKGVPHTFRVESAGGGRWFTVTSHTDFERFVRAVGTPAPRRELPPTPPPPTPDAIAHLGTVAAQHGIDIAGPPLH